MLARKKEHPIFAVYVKCYNKLYARVRKGNLDRNSELFTKLNFIRDLYGQIRSTANGWEFYNQYQILSASGDYTLLKAVFSTVSCPLY